MFDENSELKINPAMMNFGDKKILPYEKKYNQIIYKKYREIY